MECLHWFSSNCDLSESPRSNSYHNLPTLPQDNLKLMYKQISSSMEVTDCEMYSYVQGGFIIDH